MKIHQTDLDLEQRVWQRMGGGEESCDPLLRQAEAEWAGIRRLGRAGNLGTLAGANVNALRGMIILDGGTPTAAASAIPSPTGLLATLCRGSLALCREYEARCTKSPAFRALYTREQEIFTGLLELLGTK